MNIVGEMLDQLTRDMAVATVVASITIIYSTVLTGLIIRKVRKKLKGE